VFSPQQPFSNAGWRLTKTHLGFAVFFSALVNLLYLAPTIYMIQVYDRVVPTRGGMTLIFVTVVILFALATLALLDQVRNNILHRASITLDQQLGPRLVRMTLTGQSGGGASQQVMRNFDTVKQMLGSPALGAVMDLPWTPIYIIVATIIHPYLGLATIVGAVILLVLAIANDRATRAASKAASEASSSTYFAQEALGGALDTIRALGMREALVRQFVVAREQSAAAGRAATQTSSRYGGVIRFARLALQSLALGVGALLAIKDLISAGAIISASVLMARALAPIDQVVGSWRYLGDARNALNQLNEFMRGHNEETARTALPRPRPLLQVEGVTVVAPGQERLILRDVSFTIDKPAIVAVAGASGAGKTTLLQLLANARAPDRGAVRLDHAKHADWNPEQLSEHIGYLPQDSVLLSGTIKDNISRFRSRLGEDVDAGSIEAATQAGVHSMILRLPGGYDTMLGPRGRGLSAGQQQRVGLARAFYGNPVLVVLDEPYSALDAESEANLVDALKALRDRGSIVVLAAHKTSFVNISDYLAVMHDGALQAFGPTEAVLARLRGNSPTPGRTQAVS
jgi:PrtD family type I secretion system ABC transporter